MLGEKLRLRENRQVWFVIDLFTHSHSHCAQFIHLSQYKIALIETRTHNKDTREIMALDLYLATENVEQVSIHLSKKLNLESAHQGQGMAQQAL